MLDRPGTGRRGDGFGNHRKIQEAERRLPLPLRLPGKRAVVTAPSTQTWESRQGTQNPLSALASFLSPILFKIVIVRCDLMTLDRIELLQRAKA